MDISMLQQIQIEAFAVAYGAATVVFRVAPDEASPRMRKKIRKWLMTRFDFGVLPPEAQVFLDKSKTDQEVMDLLTACQQYVCAEGTRKQQQTDATLEGFSDEVKQAFRDLLEGCVEFEEVTQEPGKLILEVGLCYGYRQELILFTDDRIEMGPGDLLFFDDAQVMKAENGWRLICGCKDKILGIDFHDAAVNVMLYRADSRPHYDGPWEMLFSTAALVAMKAEELGDAYLNEKERDLLPLCRELRALGRYSSFREKCPNHALLKEYFAAHGLSKLSGLLDKIRDCPPKFDKRIALLTRLCRVLDQAKYESLWRELWGLVSASQDGYAQWPAAEQENVEKLRARIEKQLYNLGYEGKYPTFRKVGGLKGLRLEESHGESYFISGEKNVEFRIECQEDHAFGQCRVVFLCGTALLRKNESLTDVYSCCFDAKGRRLIKTVTFEDEEIGTLEEYVTVAAKKAECARLSKREKQLYAMDRKISWQECLLMFLCMGGMFAILWTAGMFMFSCILTAVMVGFSEIPDMIAAMPWGWMFAGCFVCYGGVMTVVEILAKRK